MKRRLLDNTKEIIQNLVGNVKEFGYYDNQHNMVFFVDNVNNVDLKQLDEELKKNNLKLSGVDEINNRIFVKVMYSDATVHEIALYIKDVINNKDIVKDKRFIKYNYVDGSFSLVQFPNYTIMLKSGNKIYDMNLYISIDNCNKMSAEDIENEIITHYKDNQEEIEQFKNLMKEQ